jgi:hypothetical protein
MDKHLFSSHIDYEKECLTLKSSHDKRISPWCLLLLRHRIPFNDSKSIRRDRRHMLPRFDLPHIKFGEGSRSTPRSKFRDINSAPSWTYTHQSRPLFQSPNEKALPFSRVVEVSTQSPVPHNIFIIDHSRNITVHRVTNISANINISVQATTKTTETTTEFKVIVPVTQLPQPSEPPMPIENVQPGSVVSIETTPLPISSSTNTL